MSDVNMPQRRPAEKPQGPDSRSGEKRMSVEKAMEQAHKLYSLGHLEQAAQICSQIVAQRPRMAEAHNLMGAILHAQGDSAAAVKSLQRAIHLNDQTAQFFSNLGEIERRRGKVPEALVALRRATSLDPNSAQAWNNLGIVHYDRREFQEAVNCYERAVALNSSYPEAHSNLGNAFRALGKNEEALDHYQRALLIRENYPEAYNNMAAVLRGQSQFEEAEHAYRKAIALKPAYLEAYNNLASLLVQRERIDDALRWLGDALEIDAKHVPTLLQVARIQLGKGNYNQTEQACRLILKIDPNAAEAHSLLGEVLHETDRFSDALAAYETALTLKPELTEAHNLYGICLKSVGRLDEAREQFLKTLELSPWAYGCYANLGDLVKFTADNPQLLAMEKILNEAPDATSDRYIALHFGIGKAYEDIGEYQKAFSHFQTGAVLKRAKLKYDEAESFGFFDSIRETFDAGFFANPPFEGNPSAVPVFIIGMPRSGSTLVEQILSSHPQASGAGEIKEFSRGLTAIRSRFPSLPKFPKIGLKMNSDQYKLLSDAYLAKLRSYAPEAERITDKLLTNYYFAGMIHVSFPNAKFIRCKRNPVDTCLSSYGKLFKDDMPHSYDLGELGRYYIKCQELLDYWEQALPSGTLHTAVYEEVVDDLEGAARQLIEFVGLPWDPACLAFHESRRPVKTASVVQVRQPVYKTSVDKWRRYGDHLQPLLDALAYEQKGAPSASN